MIKSKLKKGNIDDCFVQLDTQQGYFYDKIREYFVLEEVKFSLVDQEIQGVIKIYISNQDQKIQPKLLNEMDLLLKKYEPEQAPILEDDKFELKACFQYLNQKSFIDLNDLTLKLSKMSRIYTCKKLVILEKMSDYFKANKVNYLKQIKQEFEQIESDININLQTIDQSQFEEFLIEANLKYDIDFKFTENTIESSQFVINSISKLIDYKYKLHGDFQFKTHQHTDKASYYGFQIKLEINGYYSLQWLDLLMNIPNVSEEKAISILKTYPSLSKLIQAYLACPEEQRESLLEKIEFNQNFDQKNKKRIGKMLSGKIYKIFTSIDPYMLINE